MPPDDPRPGVTGAPAPPPDGYPAAPPTQWPVRVAPLPPAATAAPAPRGGVVPIVALALAFAVLVSAGIGWAVVHGGQTGARTEAQAADPAETAPPTSAGPTPTVAAMWPSLVDFVERERGRRFAPAPRLESLPSAAFATTVRRWAARSAPTVAARAQLDVAFGTAPASPDAALAYEDWATSALAAYDAESGSMVVRGTLATPGVRAELVRELTRALDDQVTEVSDAERFTPADSERAFGLQAVLGGSSARVVRTYLATMTRSDRAQARSAAAAERPPEALRARLDLPGLAGLPYVDSVLAAGGPDGLDEAEASPPTTSEKVLRPDVSAAGANGAPVTAVDPPKAPADARPGSVVRQGFGLADWALVMAGGDATRALAVSQSFDWGGGAAVTWEAADGRTCATARIGGADTPALAVALRRWAAGSGRALVTTGPDRASGHQVAIVTSCST